MIATIDFLPAIYGTDQMDDSRYYKTRLVHSVSVPTDLVVPMWQAILGVTALSLALFLGSYFRGASVHAVNGSDWVRLNATLGGRLLPGEPWSKPCFTRYNGIAVEPDPERCTYVQANYFQSHRDQCQLDWTNPTNPVPFGEGQECKQGSIPSFYIDVEGSNDVLQAYAFSRRTGTTLVVKNSGHDFLGRSSAPNSLALWVHNLKSAGVQFSELYKFANDHGTEVVGGSDESVAVIGGYTQGGGHSPLSATLGLGVDRVQLQFKVVTPDGVYRVANACQNQDLFFALRGGGGGTFGVVLEGTVMATPARKYQMASINWPVSDANLRQVLAVFIERAEALVLQGWGGYFTPSTGSLVMTCPDISPEEAKSSMQGLLDLTESLGGVSTITSIETIYEWFQKLARHELTLIPSAVGLPNAMTSRFIPQRNHVTEKDRTQLLDALMNAIDLTVYSQIHIVMPYGFKGSDGTDTSVTPTWRESLYQIVLVNAWFVDATLADREAAYARSTKAVDFIRAITPDSGSYLNEADIHEPDYKVSFWGGNYDKLAQIKKK
ncbi:hypothetical protein B0H34DRAFT_672644 [Crassisporium funariophilum]|nr:hypothetical protein B0H34DRAFT_672644 [Crassisporium funariophilum]